MAALILDERCVVLARFMFFLLIKMQHAISGTSAATYKVYAEVAIEFPLLETCRERMN